MATSFVPLRLRSNYSLLYGLMEPASIAVQLKQLGFRAGALVDQNNLYGAIEFYQAAIQNGVKPIVGAEVRSPKSSSRLVLIAFNRKGYSNLCRIITDNNLDPNLDLLEAVMESSNGIGVLCPDTLTARKLASQIGEAGIWVEVILNRQAPSQIRQTLEEAKMAKLKAVPTWEVISQKADDLAVSQVLMAIRRQELITQVPIHVRQPCFDACLKMPRIIGDQSLLKETLKIADMVDLDLGLGEVHFPRMTPQDRTSIQLLRALCLESLGRKYPRDRAKAAQRLSQEIDTIAALGFADYFLCVKKIVDFARSEGIAIAGRGSGASSIVAYLLGITQVDPIREGLCFERFLNPHRPDYPDIDLDVAWDKRDKMISFVYREFGRSKTAMVSTRVRFEIHSALWNVARVFGFAPSEARALTASLSCHAQQADICKALLRIRPDMTHKVASTIARMALRLVGIPAHSSIHCGGVVIADTQLTDYTPLEIAPKGIEVTQFDMDSIQKIGLIKIDLLGNRALAVIATTKAWLRTSRISDKPNLATNKTSMLLESGSTVTCFQLESPAMRSLLKMLQARTLDDLTLALALVRPGPSLSGAKSKIIAQRRKASHRQSDSDPSEPEQECLVYEEDVMQLISQVTGLDLGQADIIRRLIKQDSNLARQHLEALATQQGLDCAAINSIWQKLERFANYTFCKAHAASYARLAYITAWLKANYPVEFYAAALSNHSGMYPLWVHVNEARRIGVKVLLPDVNFSDEDFKVENGAVRTGLSRIKFLSRRTIETIIREHKVRRFENLLDFLIRVDISKDEAMALIASGALDGLETCRSKAIATYLIMRSQKSQVSGLPLIEQAPFAELPFQDPDYLDLRRMEYDFLGFSPLIHPVYLYNGCSPDAYQHEIASVLRKRSGGAMTFDGLLACLRYHRAGNSAIWFLSIDNPVGIFDCMVCHTAMLPRLEIGGAYRVKAFPVERSGVTSWRVQTIEPLLEPHKEHKIFLDQINAFI